MRLDGAHAHEELGGDLLVRVAVGGELGDSPLRLGQLVRGRAPTADPPELRAGLLRPEAGAELLEDRERLLQRLARGLPLLRLPAHRAEAEQGAAALERKRKLLELGKGSSNAARAAAGSSSADARRPRQREATAIAHGLPARLEFNSYCVR